MAVNLHFAAILLHRKFFFPVFLQKRERLYQAYSMWVIVICATDKGPLPKPGPPVCVMLGASVAPKTKCNTLGKLKHEAIHGAMKLFPFFLTCF